MNCMYIFCLIKIKIMPKYIARWKNKNGEPLLIDGSPAESDSLMELRQVVNRYLKLTQRNWEEVELFRIGKKSTYKFNR